MSIFPFINGDDGILETAANNFPVYYEVAWDFVNDRAIFQDGNPKIVEKNEAISVWVYKALLTSRYEHSIYTWNYGSELMSLIGKAYTPQLTESEAKRYIIEALEVNPYILEINVINASFNNGALNADIKLLTIYGESEVKI